LPVQEVIREPGIVHYAGAGKPWGDELVPYGEHWKEWERRAYARLGSPPE
jgi:lipopolysaccharide biosynthesis glycosyltransferase